MKETECPDCGLHPGNEQAQGNCGHPCHGTKSTGDPLKPSAALLCKLGSIVAHIDEGLDDGGHAFDWTAATALINDQEVQAWLARMDKLALLPRRR